MLSTINVLFPFTTLDLHKKYFITTVIYVSFFRYSYKLAARTKGYVTPRGELEPQLTVTTLVFPDDTSFNTGSSLKRWANKTPRLTSAKRKNHTPRKNMLDDEYDFSYPISELLDDNDLDTQKNLGDINQQEQKNLALDLKEYYVSSDIEELMLKSQRTGEKFEQRGPSKKEKNRKRDKSGDTVKQKRNKFKKTLRFSFSKPPSPETEQVIRVDVTSNVSFEEKSQLEYHMIKNDLMKNDCTKGHGKLISGKLNDLSARKFDKNNNEKYGDLSNEGGEEDFIVKCRQLALTQKKAIGVDLINTY